jgi:sugar O-acyltransferase (sialic acid O-acetyltransferase NeuD family)
VADVARRDRPCRIILDEEKTPMAKLVIFGAGAVARLAHHYFTRDTEHEVAGFVVDREFLQGDSYLGLPLVAPDELTRRFPPDTHQAFAALSYAGMNHRRAEKYQALRDLGYTLASYVSSRCTNLTDEPVGDNCFILEDNTIQPFVRIGNDVTLWSGNHIGHDAIIGDHCFITSHVVISGYVRVHPYCFIGVNATLHNSITIAEATLVGAGAVITKDTEAHAVYVPRRAEKLERRSDQVDL